MGQPKTDSGMKDDKSEAAPIVTEPPEPPKPPRILSFLARHGMAVLALAALVTWLPGILLLPALDRDESRFAQSSRQMLESGNFVDIRFGEVPRYKKPVGIYWLQSATTAVTGFLNPDRRGTAHIWTYRLTSLLGGIAALWLTFWCGGWLAPETGLLAGRLMAAAILLVAEATMATTDAVLLATIIVLQGVLLKVYRTAKESADPPPGKLVLMGWAAMGVGILIKGPVAPGVALATLAALFAWDRDWKEGRWKWLANTRPLPGVILAAVICAPWAIAIALESHGAFFQQSLGGDFAAKVAGGQEGHGAWPGYYLLLSALAFWPAILFVLPGIGLGLSRKSEPMIRFLLAWAGAWWLVVELVPTKLPNYALPAFPPLAILAALWLAKPEADTGWRRALCWIAALQFLVGLLALSAAALWLPGQYALHPPALLDNGPLVMTVGLAALLGLIAMVFFLMGQKLLSLVPAFVSAMILTLTLTAWVGPSLDKLWVSERLAALVAKDRHAGDPPPAAAGYEEPSLVFALGADIALTDGKGAAERGARLGGLALVDDQEQPPFLARLAEMQASAAPLDDLSGFNYSRGKTVHVTLYRVTPLAVLPTPLPTPSSR